jgi:hypothetical protein
MRTVPGSSLLCPSGAVALKVVRIGPEIALEWNEGEPDVAWEYRGVRVEKRFPEPPSTVVTWANPSSVIVVEPIMDGGRLDNAIVFAPSGMERLRLVPPAVTSERSWRLGYYAVLSVMVY